jgi:hypothetical protein
MPGLDVRLDEDEDPQETETNIIYPKYKLLRIVDPDRGLNKDSLGSVVLDADSLGGGGDPDSSSESGSVRKDKKKKRKKKKKKTYFF